jgi:hypothetical protein
MSVVMHDETAGRDLITIADDGSVGLLGSTGSTFVQINGGGFIDSSGHFMQNAAGPGSTSPASGTTGSISPGGTTTVSQSLGTAATVLSSDPDMRVVSVTGSSFVIQNAGSTSKGFAWRAW